MQEMTDQALDIITRLDSMYMQKRFEEVNYLLRDLEVEKLTTAQLLAYLTSSKIAKDKLPYRAEFYRKVEEFLRNHGRLEKDLLKGLE